MFSTANVDAPWASLWKTQRRTFADNHLARRDEFLRSAIQVFHSRCGCFANKAVEKHCNCLLQRAVLTP